MFAVILIPNFSLQAWLRLHEEWRGRAFAVLDEESRILQMTAAARESYVEAGMTPTQAMARCQKIVLRARSPLQEEAAQKALLQCGSSFSPFLESTGAGICTINLRGLSEFNLETLGLAERAQNWGGRVIDRVGALQMQAQVGVAADPDVALLAARQAESVLLVSHVAEFLETVPLQAAGLPAHLLQVISKWGLQSVGELRELGADELASRFGGEMVDFLEGLAPARVRPLTWMTPEAEFVEFMELEREIESLEPLLFVLRRFLDQLSYRLESVYLVAQELRLTLLLADGGKYERTLAVPAPTRNVNTLFRMLHTHLENLQTEAPIVAARLRAEPSRAQSHQFGLFQASLRDPNQFYETLARLEGLLGHGRSGTPVNNASYRADDFRMEPPRFHGQFLGESSGAKETVGSALRRFRPPVAAMVELDGEAPAHLKSARAKGKIVEANGPWRSSGRWWEAGEGWGRDEWDVRLSDGRGYRLFQKGNEWFLEAEFD